LTPRCLGAKLVTSEVVVRKVVPVSLLAVALLVPPAPSFAWSHGGRWRHPGFGHGVMWDTGVGWVDPDDVAVLPQFAEPVPSEAPVPDPKFVFPPTPSASSPTTGSHTGIVQRGSQIEVQSFPTTR
jgi:hypothetical protein